MRVASALVVAVAAAMTAPARAAKLAPAALARLDAVLASPDLEDAAGARLVADLVRADASALAHYPVLEGLVNGGADVSSPETFTGFAFLTADELEELANSAPPGERSFEGWLPPAPRRRNDGAGSGAAGALVPAGSAPALVESGAAADGTAALAAREGAGVPASYDARAAHPTCRVSPRRQKCGSCGIFSVVEAYSWKYCMEARDWERRLEWKGKAEARPVLSSQYGLDCIIKACKDGSLAHTNLDFFRTAGWPAETCYPSVAPEVRPCQKDRCAASHYKMRGYHFLGMANTAADFGANVERLKRELAEAGPVYARLRFNKKAGGPHSLFAYGKSATKGRRLVYKAPRSADKAKDAHHGVVVVGYGGEGADAHWIIQNSWGPDWGDGGFGYVSVRGNYIDMWDVIAVRPALRLGAAKERHLKAAEDAELRAAEERRRLERELAEKREQERLAKRREADRQTASYLLLVADESRAYDRMRELVNKVPAEYRGVGRIWERLDAFVRKFKEMGDVLRASHEAGAMSKYARHEAFYENFLLARDADQPVWYTPDELAGFAERDLEGRVRGDVELVVNKVRSAVGALRWLTTTEDGAAYRELLQEFFHADCHSAKLRGEPMCGDADFERRKWSRWSTTKGYKYGRAKQRDFEDFGVRARELLALTPGGNVLNAEGKELYWADSQAGFASSTTAQKSCGWVAQLCCAAAGNSAPRCPFMG